MNLQQLIARADRLTKKGNAEVFMINSDNLHLVDFNNDGEKDVIYLDKRHYQRTVLFEKRGSNFNEIWSGSGALVNVKQGKKTTIFYKIPQKNGLYFLSKTRILH